MHSALLLIDEVQTNAPREITTAWANATAQVKEIVTKTKGAEILGPNVWLFSLESGHLGSLSEVIFLVHTHGQLKYRLLFFPQAPDWIRSDSR
jgi:hypothetical protein